MLAWSEFMRVISKLAVIAGKYLNNMENINKLIECNKLEEALEIVNEVISNPQNYTTDRYHQLLFAKARIFMIKYKTTKPVDNRLYLQAKEDLATADNAYLAMYGKHHPEFNQAITSADIIYRELNMR
jgi:ribosomal protein L22